MAFKTQGFFFELHRYQFLALPSTARLPTECHTVRIIILRWHFHWYSKCDVTLTIPHNLIDVFCLPSHHSFPIPIFRFFTSFLFPYSYYLYFFHLPFPYIPHSFPEFLFSASSYEADSVAKSPNNTLPLVLATMENSRVTFPLLVFLILKAHKYGFVQNIKNIIAQHHHNLSILCTTCLCL